MKSWKFFLKQATEHVAVLIIIALITLDVDVTTRTGEATESWSVSQLISGGNAVSGFIQTTRINESGRTCGATHDASF